MLLEYNGPTFLQWCSEAVMVPNGVGVGVWPYPNALEKRLSNYLYMSTLNRPLYAEAWEQAQDRDKMGVEFFSNC